MMLEKLMEHRHPNPLLLRVETHTNALAFCVVEKRTILGVDSLTFLDAAHHRTISIVRNSDFYSRARQAERCENSSIDARLLAAALISVMSVSITDGDFESHFFRVSRGYSFWPVPLLVTRERQLTTTNPDTLNHDEWHFSRPNKTMVVQAGRSYAPVLLQRAR